MSAAEAEGAEDAATENEDTEEEERAELVENMTVIVRAEVLQKVIDQLLTVVDEAIFRIGYDGLSVTAVDPANVGMVDMDVKPGAFESVGDGMFPIGLNLQRLDDYIDGASGGDPVTLSFQPETLSVEIEHTNVEVEMAGISTDAMRGEPDIPELDHSVEFTTEAGVFRDAVENAELVSDHVEFEAAVDDQELVVSGLGDTDKIETVLDSDELPEASFDEDATSLYSLAYLVGGSTQGSRYTGMLKPLNKGTDLRVGFSEEYPVKMHYDFADGFGHTTLMLAPRVQSR